MIFMIRKLEEEIKIYLNNKISFDRKNIEIIIFFNYNETSYYCLMSNHAILSSSKMSDHALNSLKS